MNIIDIKTTSMYKDYYGYTLKLILITPEIIYHESFSSEFDHLHTAKYSINNATSIKGKLKFYNQLKNNCKRHTSYKEERVINVIKTKEML